LQTEVYGRSNASPPGLLTLRGWKGSPCGAGELLSKATPHWYGKLPCNKLPPSDAASNVDS
jgi:hypothetical protein